MFIKSAKIFLFYKNTSCCHRAVTLIGYGYMQWGVLSFKSFKAGISVWHHNIGIIMLFRSIINTAGQCSAQSMCICKNN